MRKFFPLKMDGDVTYEEVWKTRTKFNMVAIEEGQMANWTEGRFVCIGDAVHKVVPSRFISRNVIG
jgi:hypothetical protein